MHLILLPKFPLEKFCTHVTVQRHTAALKSCHGHFPWQVLLAGAQLSQAFQEDLKYLRVYLSELPVSTLMAT